MTDDKVTMRNIMTETENNPSSSKAQEKNNFPTLEKKLPTKRKSRNIPNIHLVEEKKPEIQFIGGFAQGLTRACIHALKRDHATLALAVYISGRVPFKEYSKDGVLYRANQIETSYKELGRECAQQKNEIKPRLLRLKEFGFEIIPVSKRSFIIDISMHWNRCSTEPIEEIEEDASVPAVTDHRDSRSPIEKIEGNASGLQEPDHRDSRSPIENAIGTLGARHRDSRSPIQKVAAYSLMGSPPAKQKETEYYKQEEEQRQKIAAPPPPMEFNEKFSEELQSEELQSCSIEDEELLVDWLGKIKERDLKSSWTLERLDEVRLSCTTNLNEFRNCFFYMKNAHASEYGSKASVLQTWFWQYPQYLPREVPNSYPIETYYQEIVRKMNRFIEKKNCEEQQQWKRANSYG